MLVSGGDVLDVATGERTSTTLAVDGQERRGREGRRRPDGTEVIDAVAWSSCRA